MNVTPIEITWALWRRCQLALACARVHNLPAKSLLDLRTEQLERLLAGTHTFFGAKDDDALGASIAADDYED